MIIEPSCNGISTEQQQLPAVSVESMTQIQLRELIPKLVTFSTGESCDVSEKPKWWTDDVPWRENGDDKFNSQDEVGVEVLRELIRGCYKYLGQEDLLMCPDLPAEMKPLPFSPQLAESPLKAAEPSSDIEVKAGPPNVLQEPENPSITDNVSGLSEDMETSCDASINKEEPVDGIPDSIELSGGAMNKDYDFLDLIDEEERERSLGKNEDSLVPDADSEMTETSSVNSEKPDSSKAEKPDSSKTQLNNENLTLEYKSESKEISETDKISVSLTLMTAKKETDNNEMDVNDNEKHDEIDACQEAEADSISADYKTETVEILIKENMGSDEIRVGETTETNTASDSEIESYEIMVNENMQGDEKQEITIKQMLDAGLMSDGSNINSEMKVMERTDDDAENSCSETIETGNILVDHETETSTESTSETGETFKISAEVSTEIDHQMDMDKVPSSENLETDKVSADINTAIDEIATSESGEADYTTGQIIEAGAVSTEMAGESRAPNEHTETTNEGIGEHLEKQEDDVVWICFVCAKEFPDQTELMTHQDNCEDSADEQYAPMETEDTDIPAENIIDQQGSGGLQPHFFVTPTGLTTNPTYSEMTVSSKSPVVLEQSTSSLNSADAHSAASFPVLSGQLQAPVLMADITGAPVASAPTSSVSEPVPTLLTKVGSQFKSLPLGLPLSRKRKRKRWPELYIPPPPDVYFNSLGLGPTPKVKEIEETPKKVDKDCDIIDLTVEESKPVTPRTPRSLMSQWSRDEASGRRRQLSFTQNSQPEKKEKEEEDDSSSDSDSSEGSREERAPKRNVPCKSTIYAIPLTSPLGQRLKKHWQNENQVPVVSDIEQFCRTSFNSSGNLSTKARDVMDKLRHRPPPQVTFRFTKKYLNKYHHSYKFNSADRREFQKKLRTGLEKESRRLLKRMKPCKVVLSRISKKDIKYWTTRGQKIRNEYYMNQMQQHLKQRIILEQQKIFRAARYPTTGMLNNNQRFVHFNNLQFRNQSPGLPRQTFPTQLRFIGSHVQGPTPQLLVPHGAGVGGMLLVPASNPPVPQPASALRRELTGSHKRKQDFSNVRVDDEISITILSSDEEEESCDKSPNCRCNDCQSKRKCAIRQKPRIGPASFKRREAMKNQAIRNQQYCVNVGGASQYKLPVSAQKERFSALVNNESAIGRSAQGGFAVNPAKSNEFMNFRMVNGQIQNLKTVIGDPVVHQNPVPHSPLILNKSIIKRPFIQSQPGPVSSAPGSPVKGPCSPIRIAPSSPVKGPCSPVKMGSGSHVHKDDDLGFEVIMIDSEEED